MKQFPRWKKYALVMSLIVAVAATLTIAVPRFMDSFDANRPAAQVSIEHPAGDSQSPKSEAPRSTAAEIPTDPPMAEESDFPEDHTIPVAPVPQRPTVQCPVGLLNAQLLSVDVVRRPAKQFPEFELRAVGLVTNGTNARVGVSDKDVPDLQGLDAQGDSPIIELFGEWAYNPPTGTPRPDFITLDPGQSIRYSISVAVTQDALSRVIDWYTAAEVGSMLVLYPSTDFIRCPAPLSLAGRGQSIAAQPPP